MTPFYYCLALVDFTGGVTELYDIQGGPDNLFKLMQKAWERNSFLGCSIEPDPHQVEAETPQGLIRGHAYSITEIKTIDIETPTVSGVIPLLRVRNPWGNEGKIICVWNLCRLRSFMLLMIACGELLQIIYIGIFCKK